MAQRAFEADSLRPLMADAGWPLRVWVEERDVWDPATGTYMTRSRTRTLAVLSWHAHRHRFARITIDTFDAGPGVLMALGGWENNLSVAHRYYRTGREHTERGPRCSRREHPPSGDYPATRRAGWG